jgi:Kef-type K+ transport system membrane component KefB
LVIVLLLTGIAPATDPAATMNVVQESGAKGPFSSTLLGIVAVDDAWGLIFFSVMLTLAQSLGDPVAGKNPLLSGAWEIGGAIALGVALGVPMAYLTGRIRPGEPTLAEALGVVFLCGGIAQWLKVSYLLASMTLGSVVANRARHHIRPFHAIEDIEWPLMIIFFVLAGASLRLMAIPYIGLLGGMYIVCRVVGRLLGAYAGSLACNADSTFRRWMGLALMPQAGVAMGMALIAAQRFPQTAEDILPVTISATVFFELIGPILTRLSLNRTGEG